MMRVQFKLIIVGRKRGALMEIGIEKVFFTQWSKLAEL